MSEANICQIAEATERGMVPVKLPHHSRWIVRFAYVISTTTLTYKQVTAVAC